MAIKKFTLCIDEELLKKTKIRAIKEDRNANEIIAELLKEYLRTNENDK